MVVARWAAILSLTQLPIPMTRLRLFPVVSVLLVFTFLAGCSGQRLPDGMPRLFPCEIIILQGGEPLAQAMVTIIPTEEGNKWSASGRTDDAGKAIMYTWGQYAGAPEGTYKVVIGKTEVVGAPPAATTEEAARRPPDRFYELVEAIYSEASTTPLEIEVKRGTRTFTLDAGEAVRISIPSR